MVIVHDLTNFINTEKNVGLVTVYVCIYMFFFLAYRPSIGIYNFPCAASFFLSDSGISGGGGRGICVATLKAS